MLNFNIRTLKKETDICTDKLHFLLLITCNGLEIYWLYLIFSNGLNANEDCIPTCEDTC